ncbi:general secretion pathway protein G [Mariprofundus micogutta]|uniref:General secretion pathway protein G n=1 Tax=Mariprofundus micogutta TaxID=1921010 RepID=A0A1L8CQM1_9PROT|nr:prepilin-type N-terminal cleavage/methylation domain-containing protein [Mariprofundus micogutta]GAV21174.1 general secretion pathway protein G [Mariprofundus micogutta]
MMNMINKEKGFTLIELMIVVAIIGILASIAIPQFASYRVKAFNAAAQADLHSAQTTFEVYFNDNSHYPNTTAPGTGAVTITDGTTTGTVNTSSNSRFASDDDGNAGSSQTYGAATKHDSGDLIYTTTSGTPTIGSSTGTKGTALVAGDVPTTH